MKIAIYGRPTKDNISEPIQILFNKLKESNIEVLIYEPFYQFISKELKLTGSYKTFTSHTGLKAGVNFMFSLGGDGTFLETLIYVRDSGIPILGINTGRLGFLANVAKTEIGAAIDALIENRYSIEARALLSLSTKNNLFGDLNYAMNELTIMKKDSLAMVTVNAYVNGEYLNSYFADGLIIATPTGSTAYSLSCGGPLVMPGSQNFLITPIAPHNLNVRPLIISDNNVITLKISGRSKQYLVTMDSRSEVVDTSVELTLKKAGFYANLVKLENQSFFNTIRNKLLWGLDKRN
ncbi:MAG TPA: NAD kinase [Bacteroidia bacterium]|jgi:NAD+ kinase|nr:NAD kinase [Bacteroidia bacterium]